MDFTTTFSVSQGWAGRITRYMAARPNGAPEQLQTATARAVRGATLLKRASAAATFNQCTEG